VTTEAFAPAGLTDTELVSPASIEDACRVIADAELAKKRVTCLAGGTDWIVDRHLSPIARAHVLDLVVDLTRIESLQTIERVERDGEVHFIFGGGVTYWQLRHDPRIVLELPILASMAKDVGAVQIQTRGTLGGNIASASPAADGVPCLMALDGVATLTSTTGSRAISLDSFFLGYRKTALNAGEIITAIDVRVPKMGAIVRWRKVGTRLAQAISKVALASVVEIDSSKTITRARFGMASVAATTTPLKNVRDAVEGKLVDSISQSDIDAALARDIQPIDDVRSTGAYRMHVASALVRDAIMSSS
jgi:xanthine dehydrogenase small subunit